MADEAAAKADSPKTLDNGPHPTLAIVTFLHGILEIVFRAILIGLALAAIIAGSVGQDNTSDDSLIGSLDVQGDSNAACGWIIFVGVMTLIYEGTFIFLRFCNCGFFSKNIQRFLWIDFFVSIIFALAYFAPAVALAVYANEWDDLINSNRGAVFEGTLKETRNAVRAAAVFAFFAMFGFIGFAVYIFLFRSFNWNSRMEK